MGMTNILGGGAEEECVGRTGVGVCMYTVYLHKSGNAPLLFPVRDCRKSRDTQSSNNGCRPLDSCVYCRRIDGRRIDQGNPS